MSGWIKKTVECDEFDPYGIFTERFVCPHCEAWQTYGETPFCPYCGEHVMKEGETDEDAE